MRFFDLSLLLNGYDINRARQELKRIQNLDDQSRKVHLEKSRKAIVDYHVKHNPFYKNHIISSNTSVWTSIPVMTKSHLQKPLEQRLSNTYKRRKTYVNKTSGSSGDPFIFAKDKWCHAMTWAQIMDRFQWYGIDFNYSKQARFYGIPLNLIGNKKERIKDWLAHRYRFSVFDLSDKAFEQVLKRMKSTPFDYINGYTSPIIQFGKFLDKKGIILKDICPSLKVCVVTSEMLFKEDRKLLERCLGVPIVNEYGASELDLIAFENTKGEWLLNNDTLYVEILDDNDQVLPNGEEGRIVITSLLNKAHPFIRYDIGDIGVMDEASNPSKPILKTLVGRSNDLIILPSGRTAAGLTFYYITKSVIEESGNVKEFVIEQTALSKFIIYYVADTDIGVEHKKLIRSEIIKYLEPGLEIQLVRKPFLKRSKSGKLKQFTSTI